MLRTHLRMTLPALMYLALALNPGAHAQQQTGAEAVTGAEVGRQVQIALQEADATGLGGLHLKKAVLNLEYAVAIGSDFKVNFLIFTISHAQRKAQTQTTTLTFSRMPRPAGAAVKNIEDIKEHLARAIAEAAVLASQVNVLPLEEGSFKIEFFVEKKPSGGVSFKILGGEVGGGVDLDKTSKNSLEVTFAR